VSIQTLVMPKLGLTMTEGKIVEWPFKVGERFARGDTYLVVETEKAANDIEAPEAGVFTKILVPEGETVETGMVLAEWEMDASSAASQSSTEPAPQVSVARDSPLAREPRKLLVTPIQLKAAERMVEAKRNIPHFYLATEIAVDALQEARARWNAANPERRASITHLLLAAVVQALGRHPQLNRVWSGDGVIGYDTIDVGLAVDTPQGLLAPVLRDLGGMPLAAVVAAAKALIGRARMQQLSAADIGGGMVTISNAGMHDVSWMASIINPGQAAILGVGAERVVFRPGERGEPRAVREISVVLSCDHRVFSGTEGLTLLNAIKSVLENPEPLLPA